MALDRHSMSPGFAGLIFVAIAAQSASPSPSPSQTATAATPTQNPSSTATPTPGPSETPTPTNSSTVASATFTPSASAVTTITMTPVPTNAPTASPVSVPTPTMTPFPLRSVLINEVAWGGTSASSSDEWIELQNTSATAIDLGGWELTDQNDLSVSLHGTVAPYSYFLLERTDDSTVSNIAADQLYTGALKNSGETLLLIDPSGVVIDSANRAGGGWPAGDSGARASMERRGGGDIPGNWATSNGLGGMGIDAAGAAIRGTPRGLNSIFVATPTATSAAPSATASPARPLSVLINEIAWAGTEASASDEWIELWNTGPSSVDLSGWTLSDGNDVSISLAGSVAAFSYFLLERTDDATISDIAADQNYTGGLSNAGETLRLWDSTGSLVDSANAAGGTWPGGESSPRRSMERRGGADVAGNWGTFTGFGGSGTDAAGNPIGGTPKRLNSVLIATPTPTPLVSPTSSPVRSILISEVAWAGTRASSSDEWIELHNPGAAEITLAGWTLNDGGDLSVALTGSIPPGGFFLLERSDDTTIADITADQIYVGNLNDGGEPMSLRDPSGSLIDSANLGAGGWPGGNLGLRYSMERWGGDDRPGNWGTFTGFFGNGKDAGDNPIGGTPRSTNSLFFPTPQPTWIPGKVLINEVLVRPRHDWEGVGGVTTADEFIELYNAGPSAVYLRGWMLDDISGSGSRPYKLPGITVDPGAFVAFFRTRTKIALNDGGDSVRLLAPNGRMIDKLKYRGPMAANLSYGRYPDGSDLLRYDLWPTPRKANVLFIEPMPEGELAMLFPIACPEGGIPFPRLNRAARWPAFVAWMHALGLTVCR